MNVITATEHSKQAPAEYELNLVMHALTRQWLKSLVNTKIDQSVPLQVRMYPHYKRPIT